METASPGSVQTNAPTHRAALCKSPGPNPPGEATWMLRQVRSDLPEQDRKTPFSHLAASLAATAAYEAGATEFWQVRLRILHTYARCAKAMTMPGQPVLSFWFRARKSRRLQFLSAH